MKCVRFNACVFNKIFLKNSYFYFNPKLAFNNGYCHYISYILSIYKTIPIGRTTLSVSCLFFVKTL